MPRTRTPKTFPPGTFLPTPQRIIVILQLCVTFSVILWNVAQPFTGEYFTVRSRMLLYEYLMGKSDQNKIESNQEAKRFEALFQELPSTDQRLFKK